MSVKDLKNICEEVLSKILPTPEETQQALNLFNEISLRLEPLLKDLNYPYRISLEGSVSKNTHLRNDMDLDVFVLIRYEGMSKEWLEDLVDDMCDVLSEFRPIKLYASHPYLRFKEGGIEVDVVPAYMAHDVGEIRTAVDRTIFHTNFVKGKLNGNALNEVRLLKKFFKGIEVYGAEIKTEGFSGYLTELIIIYYGSFIDAVKGISNWRFPQVVDLHRRYDDMRDYLRIYGKRPLIFPDPVDHRRNVAAALSVKSFSSAVLACRRFLERPSVNYFFPKVEVGGWNDLEGSLNERKTAVVGYIISYKAGTSPDVIWGELKKCLRRGENILRQFNFEVFDSNLWCDEVSKAVLLYEVFPPKLHQYALHVGPKAFRGDDADKFIRKYLRAEGVVGPWINELGDLMVLKTRKYLTPYDVLFNEAGKVLQVKHIERYKVIDVADLREIFVGFDDFRVWLYKFVRKKPLWLDDAT